MPFRASVREAQLSFPSIGCARSHETRVIQNHHQVGVFDASIGVSIYVSCLLSDCSTQPRSKPCAGCHPLHLAAPCPAPEVPVELDLIPCLAMLGCRKTSASMSSVCSASTPRNKPNS